MTNQQKPARPLTDAEYRRIFSVADIRPPRDLPGHERKPHWFDADRSGFSETPR